MVRFKTPAGGQITGGGTETGGTYQKGGQFAAKARQRIRTVVMAWLRNRVKLARSKAKANEEIKPTQLAFDEPHEELKPHAELPKLPAPDVAIRAAKDRAAQEQAGDNPVVTASPQHIRKKLTIRELKDVEGSLALPDRLKLTRLKTNVGRKDGEEVGDIDQDVYYRWANEVARHIQKNNLTPKAVERLRDPKHLSKPKLAFLIDRMTREVEGAKSAFADTGGASKWYGDHVGAMTRHLHDSFHSGSPADDELWGKLDPKTGRVSGGAALTLAKLLVAGTSGGEKPHRNYAVAHAMISAGRDAGDGGANPFKSIPDAQHKVHAAWIKGVTDWHEKNKTGVTPAEVKRPGTSLKDRALWYDRVILPMIRARETDDNAKTLAGGPGETNQRYSGVNATYVSDPTSDHHGAPVAVEKGKDGWRSPYPSLFPAPLYRPLSENDRGRLPAPSGEDDYSATLENEHKNRGQIRQAKLPQTDGKGYLQAPGWTSRNEQARDNVGKINAVVNYFTRQVGGDEREGMKAAAHFLLHDQSPETFNQIVTDVSHTDPVAGKKLAKAVKDNNGFYFSGDHLPGAFLLGPKFGAFAMNLHLDGGQHDKYGSHLTADLWWSRDWNVMLGTLFGPKNEKTSRQETPRGTGASHPERKLMRKVAKHAAERAGLNSVAELQAVLWYYEQQKPRWFGVNTSSTSYLDGVNLVAATKNKRYIVEPNGNINVKQNR